MIAKIRQQFPEYSDMDDNQLLGAIHQKHYADMPREQFDQLCGCCRPNHDNLAAAAVTGEDSLQLQETDSAVKPVVKMTPAELLPLADRVAEKLVIIWQGAAYVLDPTAIDPTEVLPDILSGNDSAILGYPAKGDQDAAVTKQGEVVTDLPTMRRHAEAGNVAWAANGSGRDLMDKAQKVAAAIQHDQRRNQVA